MLDIDYLDLEQLQSPVLSQALDTQRAGRSGPPLPMAEAPEALQAEIHYVTTLWAQAVRERHRLNLRTPDYVVGAWHTTASNPPPKPRRRPGLEIQQAVVTLAPRMLELSRIGPMLLYPTGCDDIPAEVTGWEAVHQLARLHQHARGMLGRTNPTMVVPGACSGTDPTRPDEMCAEPLYRDGPRYERDPCPVYCKVCGATWTYDEYERYVGLELVMLACRPGSTGHTTAAA